MELSVGRDLGLQHPRKDPEGCPAQAGVLGGAAREEEGWGPRKV